MAFQRAFERRTEEPKRVTTLSNGDHMSQKEFHELYKQTPENFKAELIDGVVFVASPVSTWHGRPHARMVHWLSAYQEETPGTDVFDDTTTILDPQSEPQPDLAMILLPEGGGRTRIDEEGYLRGAPEIVVEIAHTTVNMDMHEKQKTYDRAGVNEYIVVLCQSKTVCAFARNAQKIFAEWLPRNGILKSRTFPGLWLDTAAIFEPSIVPLMKTLRSGLASSQHRNFAMRLARKIKNHTDSQE